jgi:RecA-family ATPase
MTTQPPAGEVRAESRLSTTPAQSPLQAIALPHGAESRRSWVQHGSGAPIAPNEPVRTIDGISYPLSFFSGLDRDAERVSAQLDPLRNPVPVTRVSMHTARRGRPEIVEGMYFADVGHIAAPGSTGKTTVLLYHCIQIAIGGIIFGHEVLQSGPVVYVTAEDDAESIQYRLGQMCKELELTNDDIDLVCGNVQIIDATGHSAKLTTVEKEVIVPSSRANTLIGTLKVIDPVMVFIDPLVSFGVGESRVNDAEQGMIEVGRRIVKQVGCGVIFVHHTGKANARESTLDQYSGRGGSALADGSRMVFVLQPLSPDKWTEATGDVLMEGETALVFASPKLTWCPPQPHIYIKRNGFTFIHFDHSGGEEGAQAVIERNAAKILQFLREGWPKDERHTAKTLEATKVVKPRDALRQAVEHLVVQGKVVEEPLNIGHGRPKKLLRPVDRS